jgi:hypothetical protein
MGWFWRETAPAEPSRPRTRMHRYPDSGPAVRGGHEEGHNPPSGSPAGGNTMNITTYDSMTSSPQSRALWSATTRARPDIWHRLSRARSSWARRSTDGSRRSTTPCGAVGPESTGPTASPGILRPGSRLPLRCRSCSSGAGCQPVARRAPRARSSPLRRGRRRPRLGTPRAPRGRPVWAPRARRRSRR